MPAHNSQDIPEIPANRLTLTNGGKGADMATSSSTDVLRIVRGHIASIGATALHAEVPAITGTHTRLFLDDHLIAEMHHLTRTVHRPTMYEGNPVLTYDKPWEFSCVTLWGSVLFDERDTDRLSRLAGAQTRIRFEYTRGQLYSFRVR